MENSSAQQTSTVYGPVQSWRFGLSLGIDPIFEISTCSFNCVYCQLGDIQKVTAERKIFVSTERVLNDFQRLLKSGVEFDVITFSGSGEPTLATNLGEIAAEIKRICPDKPLLILTNATLLNDPELRSDLQLFERVVVKLDGPDDKTLRLMNRPADGVTMNNILQGIKAFKSEYQGRLDVQMMFMPANLQEMRAFIPLLKEIQPATVQLNTPKRPYPLDWKRENRGNHGPGSDVETRTLRTIDHEEARHLEETLRQETGLEVLSVYRE